MTERSSSAGPPPPPPRATDVRCVRCGYDLSGSTVGGSCPECGTPVAEAFKARTAGANDTSLAVASLVLGVLGLLCCGILGPIAAVMGYLVVRDAPIRGYSPGTVTTARIGMILGIIGTLLHAAVLVAQAWT